MTLDSCWDIVSDASAVLKDLTDTTTYMCAEKSVSVSEIYPVVCCLLQNSLARAQTTAPSPARSRMPSAQSSDVDTSHPTGRQQSHFRWWRLSWTAGTNA